MDTAWGSREAGSLKRSIHAENRQTIWFEAKEIESRKGAKGRKEREGKLPQRTPRTQRERGLTTKGSKKHKREKH